MLFETLSRIFFSPFPPWPTLPTPKVIPKLISYCINYVNSSTSGCTALQYLSPKQFYMHLPNTLILILLNCSVSLKNSIIYQKIFTLAFKASVVNSVDAPSHILSALMSSHEAAGGDSSQPVVKFISWAPVFLLLFLKDFPRNLGIWLAVCSSNSEVWWRSNPYSSTLNQWGMRLQRWITHLPLLQWNNFALCSILVTRVFSKGIGPQLPTEVTCSSMNHFGGSPFTVSLSHLLFFRVISK